MPKQSSSVNRLDATELIEAPPGVNKVEWTPDLRFRKCGTFTLHLEDYTIGCLLRNDLLLDQRVKFIGLRQPHPLQPAIELRIQTTEDTPLAVFCSCLRRHSASVSLLKARFQAAVNAYHNTAPGGSFSGTDLGHGNEFNFDTSHLGLVDSEENSAFEGKYM